MKDEHRRKIIGFLVSGITDPFSVSLIRGVVQAARSRNIDVLIFPGQYLDREASGFLKNSYEYQFNILYSYPARTRIDGLIISSNSISCHTSQDKMREFLDAYSGIPTLLVASRMEGCPCVNYDNTSAIEEGLAYLIREEGCRHICLLGGPETNTDVQERFQVYEETLKKYHQDFEPRMCAYGDFEASAVSEQAMEELLAANPEMDAVFCQNDYMAVSAYTVLKRHGIRPGDEVKVLGYDNIVESGTFDPPLATIGADPIVLGEQSLERLLRIIDGEHVQDLTLPAKLIRRKSLGWKYSRGHESRIDEPALRENFEAIFYRYSFEHSGEESRCVEEIFLNLFRRIIQAARDPAFSAEHVEDVMKEFDQFVGSDVLTYMDMEAMIRLIDKINSSVLTSVDDIPLIIPELYRCLVQAEGWRSGTVSRRRNVYDQAKKTFVKRTLDFQHGNDRSYQVILGCLDWAGVTNGCLYIFEHPVMHLEHEHFSPPEEAFLKAYLADGVVTVPPAGRQKCYLKGSLIPEELTGQSRCMLVAPLFYSEEIYGIFVCNISDTLFTEGEFIVNQLGTAVRMLHLLAQNEAIQLQMEEQMAVIRKMNIELDSLSRHDVLTGIQNRRGFMDSAAAFLHSIRQAGQSCLIGYVDMDNLKVVNDRFGHDEGDFALKSIAALLEQTLSKEGTLLGRIGGDEFVFITPGEPEHSQIVKQKLRSAFDAFNQNSEKPFNITVSAGIYAASGETSITLEDALSYADEDLYAAKQVKNRNVLKS